MLEGRSSAPLLWVAWVAPALAFLLLGARGPLADVTWHSPLMLFWLVVVAASFCVVVALAVIAIGWIRRLAEVAILGAAVLAVSLLPLVHGLTTPGILYADNSATLVSAFLAVPLAIMIAAPVILPGLPPMRQLALRWRSATVMAILATLALAGLRADAQLAAARARGPARALAHERPDGRGYPDGLGESELPEEVGIVSVCDALDAMTSTRQYRSGMSESTAIEILRDGAGTQWSSRSVRLALAELEEHGGVETPAFARVGREAARANGERLIEDCAGALPERARVALGLGAG